MADPIELGHKVFLWAIPMLFLAFTIFMTAMSVHYGLILEMRTCIFYTAMWIISACGTLSIWIEFMDRLRKG